MNETSAHSEALFLLAACRAELIRVRDGGVCNPETAAKLIQKIEVMLGANDGK